MGLKGVLSKVVFFSKKKPEKEYVPWPESLKYVADLIEGKRMPDEVFPRYELELLEREHTQILDEGRTKWITRLYRTFGEVESLKGALKDVVKGNTTRVWEQELLKMLGKRGAEKVSRFIGRSPPSSLRDIIRTLRS